MHNSGVIITQSFIYFTIKINALWNWQTINRIDIRIQLNTSYLIRIQLWKVEHLCENVAFILKENRSAISVNYYLRINNNILNPLGNSKIKLLNALELNWILKRQEVGKQAQLLLNSESIIYHFSLIWKAI